MANLSEDIQCAGSDTRPPMLDMTDFASWQQRIRLYCRGKENGVNILKFIDEGPYQMGTVREPLAKGTERAPHLGPERPRIYSDLSLEEKDRKEDRESQLYDDFKHFRQHKGETIHDYYVRFAKLINDMRNIRMTMSRMQLNSMFMNNMLPEWGRFVATVKLNRGLRDFNYDQLYAYLKQHETHAKENKMMLERFSQPTVDPLALMSNVSNQQRYSPSSSTSSSIHVPQHLADNAHLDSSLSLIENLIENLTNMLALLTQSYKTFLPQTNNQLRTSSNTQNQATVQDGRLDMEEFITELGMPIRVKHDREDAADAGSREWGGVGRGAAIVDDCDAFDSDVDEAPIAQTMFMANLSSADPVTDEAGPSYDSDILSDVQDHDHYQDAVCAHHEEHAMHDNYVKDNAVPVVQSNVSSVPNDAFMMIYNDMYEPYAQSVSNTSRNTVVENSLTAELATYKEQVELYKRRAKFELTE
nr:hypothetical protein [Tanacetum cinerariifolium]